MKRLYFLLLFLPFLQPANVYACGYGFVGDCSTNIGLRINGTADSFAVAPCPGLASFDGLRLGTIQSLALIRAKSINWESCQNNVTAVTIYFRVFQTGTPGGAWQTLTLQENYNTLVGPYTTRYRSVSANANLTNGLTVGKDYTLEAYFRAEIDTIGDDFIPETFLLQDNEGANFRLTFRYGGASAPPFTVVETKKTEPNCFGDTTGSVSVAVYGNQSGLFYHWSNQNNNFYAQYNLAAGTYMVTVTGVGGYGQADTIYLGQPAAISNQFTNLVYLGCNNGVGQVTAQPGGGTGPYTYHWSNGQNAPTLSVTTPGSYTVTVTDSHGCTQAFTQFISGGSAPVYQNISAEICSGEVYHKGNQALTQPGTYNFTVESSSGCDTVVNLQLSVLNAGTLLASLPLTGAVTCAQPELSLCAAAQANAAYSWLKDGLPVVNSPCLVATAAGVYSVTATLAGNNRVCTAQKNIVLLEHLQAPTVSFQLQNLCNGLTSVSYSILGGLSPYQAVWNDPGITTNPFTVPAGLYTGTITDAAGCTSGITIPIVGFQVSASAGMASGPTAADGTASVAVSGGSDPYGFAWNTGASSSTLSGLPPGTYCVTVTDHDGCSQQACVEVSYSSASREPRMEKIAVYPNPAGPGEAVILQLPQQFTGRSVKVEIWDAAGRCRMQENLLTDAGMVRMVLPASVPAGLFWVRISGPQGQVIGRCMAR